MKAIFGLGNVGEKYINTRHNAGFYILDQFVGEAQFENVKKLNSLIYKTQTTVFVKPTSFMNTSGTVVKNVCKFFSIETANILVIHDDIDQKVGSYKIVQNGGSGGQKGINSILESLGTDVFTRLKIGIAPEVYNPSIHKAEDFVLKRFSEGEIEILDNLYKEKLSIEIKNFLAS